MKTAISMPDELFRRMERLARKTRRSRSRLVSDAVGAYLATHAPDEVTAAMDRACEALGQAADPFAEAATRRVLERVEW